MLAGMHDAVRRTVVDRLPHRLSKWNLEIWVHCVPCKVSESLDLCVSKVALSQ